MAINVPNQFNPAQTNATGIPGSSANPDAGPGAGPSNPSNPPPPPNAKPDWTSDPIYQLVLGQQNLAIAQAKSEALKEQIQSLIAYGDPNLALAITGDPNVAEAARQNKASTLAQLSAQNAQNVRNTNLAENAKNLWYSSDRGYQLGLAQQAYLNNSASALSGEQTNLGNIGANLLAQEQAAYGNEQSAASDAYNRAVANPATSTVTPTKTTKTQPIPSKAPPKVTATSPNVDVLKLARKVIVPKTVNTAITHRGI